MRKIFTSIFLISVVMICGGIVYDALAQPPETIDEMKAPQQIVFPKNTKLPVRYKCPTHGITENILTLEFEERKLKYCNKCVVIFVATLFDRV